MVRTMFSAALVAATLAAPVAAQDLGEIVGGVARQYLSQEQDRAAFSQAQSTGTVRAYQSYLQQFPTGLHADQARDQIRRLGGTAPREREPSATTADTSGLSRQDRINVQRRLNALGYSTNGSDGNFGPGTRRAIALWQRDRNYPQTGTLSRAQTEEILAGRGATAAENAGTRAPAAIGPADTESDLGLGRSQRATIQAALTRRGYDTRGIDGSFGPGTRNAIANWQRANGQTATGYLTAAQADSLLR